MGKARDQDSYGRNGISWPQHMSKLGQTDLVNLVTVRNFGGTDMQLGRNDSVRVWA